MGDKIAKLNDSINEIESKLQDATLCTGTASIYSRISGYFRALENWNIGKQSEFADRKSYVI